MRECLFFLPQENGGPLRVRCGGCGAVMVVLDRVPVSVKEWIGRMRRLEKDHAGCAALCQKEQESDEQASEFDLLSRALELLTSGWCQGPLAMDRNGREVASTSRRAVRFCVLGAVHRARQELRAEDGIHSGAWVRLQHAVPVTFRVPSVILYVEEEGRTHAEVLALVAQAAAEARQEGDK